MASTRKSTTESTKGKGSSNASKFNFNTVWSWVWKGALIFVGFLFLIILFVYLGIFGRLPSTADIKKLETNNASLVYSVDGKLMGGYYAENRQAVGNKEVSKFVLFALISTEDSRFFKHNGLDFISLGRVILKTVLLGDASQGGGSTISQQLAKNLYPRRKWGPIGLLVNKIREAFIASRIEEVISKEDILIMYLNTVPFGEDIYGIETASQRFFNKKSMHLNPAESATLIGMLAANTAYNPRLNPEKSKMRRDIVLKRMEVNNKLTAGEYQKWVSTPLTIQYNRIDRNTGVAPYFREKIRVKVEEILKDKYGDDYDLYTDGLKVYTTIDSRMQKYADDIVVSHMTRLQKEFADQWKGNEPWKSTSTVFTNALHQSPRYKALKNSGLSEKEIVEMMKKKVPMTLATVAGNQNLTCSSIDSIKHYLSLLNIGFMVMDAKTGHILTWVGGINHKVFQYDHVTSQRQVGSTFKPFVYATALIEGVDPCEYFSNERKVYDGYNDWSPSNSDGEYGGYYSLKGGLTYSVNTIAAEVMMKVGAGDVVDLANGIGIKSKLPQYPSIALGTADCSLYEMITAYSTFANNGTTSEPVGLLRIEDSKGKVLYKYKPTPTDYDNLDPNIARVMVEMMKGVIDVGTGRSLRGVFGLTSDLAGKTGTTQNNTDGWFIGFTPRLVAGAWVGNDNNAIHFRSTAVGQGAHSALPVFGQFMRKVEGDPRFNQYTQPRFSLLNDASMLECADFVTDLPRGNFIDQLFGGSSHKADSTKLKKTHRKSNPNAESKPSLIDKMKDLFKKE